MARAKLTPESMGAALKEARRDVFTLAGLAGLFNVLGLILIIGRELGNVRMRLGRFVNKEVAETVVDGGIRLEGRLCDASILFTDLRGFTGFSEHLPPAEVLRMLNDYFEPMVGIIERHGGWVDKFMGDGLLAVFGERNGEPEHASRAVACALELRECLARLNVQRRQGDVAALRLGVAVNSGPMILGTVGSRSRLDFTVIGDTVNVASRLEGLNSRLGTDLLVTQATFERTREAFAYEDLGDMSVRGHDAPVRTYRLISRAGALAATPRPRPLPTLS
jgi:adenylate cyclase